MIQKFKQKKEEKCFYNALYLGLLIVLISKFFKSNNELMPKEKS